MTISGALATTGGIFTLLALVLAMVAESNRDPRWGYAATTALALAVACGITAAWVEALS